MTYTTTPPSKPGLYWILFDGSTDLPIGGSVGKLTKDGDWQIIGFSQSMTAEKIVAMGGWFGPRIEPPRDDDEELATVEWLREMGIPEGMSYDPGLSFMVLESAIHIEYTDNTGSTVTLCWETPTRRKVRQIMEALE